MGIFLFNLYLSSAVERKETIIIGGGLSGLATAIDLALRGIEVQLFESKPYPHHKVCGEYVSNEILPYLKILGVDVFAHGAVPISTMEISGVGGKKVKTALPLGGFGLSRYTFDDILYQRARVLGVEVTFSKIVEIHFDGRIFHLSDALGTTHYTEILIGPLGKDRYWTGS